jgi:ferric-dicitrate binding protein FerR (iron transport regulator)
MGKSRVQEGDRCSPPIDAVDWFVEIESQRPLDEMTRARWKRWTTSRANCTEYARVMQMGCDVRALSPPPAVTGDELLADVAEELAMKGDP